MLAGAGDMLTTALCMSRHPPYHALLSAPYTQIDAFLEQLQSELDDRRTEAEGIVAAAGARDSVNDCGGTEGVDAGDGAALSCECGCEQVTKAKSTHGTRVSSIVWLTGPAWSLQ